MKKLILIFSIFIINILLAQNGNQKFTIEEIYSSNKFSSRGIRGFQWFNKGESFTYIDFDSVKKTFSIFKYDIKLKQRSVFIDGQSLTLGDNKEPFRIMNYTFSPDEKYVLFTGVLPARRLKTGGYLYLYEIATKNFFEIDTKEETMNVKFSPDGSKLGYIKKDNIYVYDLKNKTEYQLTFDGSENILNGHFDWVYEEEFGINDGWVFSPDGNEIAFWQLDQTAVPQIEIQQFDSLYFNSIKMKYPKAGGINSTVKIGVINLISKNIKWMDIGNEKDIYIPRIKWTETKNIIAIQRMNRLQTKLEILFANSETGESKVIYSEEDTTWIDIEGQNIHFTKDGKNFIISSEKDGFKHLYLYKTDGKLINQITSGKWEVNSLLNVDETKSEIYFTAGKNSPLISNLFKIDFKGKNLVQITYGKGNNTINISPNFKYIYRSYSDINTPSQIYICKITGEIIEHLEKNEKLINTLGQYSFAFPEFLTFRTTDNVELNAMMIKPKDFDATKKYPVLIYNYSGPGSQIVRDIWGGGQYLWHQMLAQDGYIIFMIDNRGTGGRGKDFERIVYKNLGYWEVNDLKEAAIYLSGLSYIDKDRIGIWGWSYGGYIAALTLMNAADYFKTGIAVAPVTDWEFYDTIYTERYNSTPQLNPEGYARGSVVKNAHKLKGNLLLCHGTADDNVHFQNTVVLVDELIKNNKQFNVMFYPGKNHGIFGGKTREQLFTLITNYIKEKI